MNLFKSNKIFLDSETVAEQLRSRRQAKKLKLDQVAKKLNISYKYLSALEKGEYDKLPSGVYGKNFLREYAVFLGLNYAQLLKDFEQEKKLFQPHEHQGIFSRQVVKKTYFWTMPRIIRNVLIGLIVVICFSYLGFLINKIVSPPALAIYSPVENLTTTDHTITVSGKTEPETGLIINGDVVLCDSNGNFSEQIELKNGINTITITAAKNYGRSRTVIRQIMVKSD